ncbi:hypothetical protein IKG28_02750 [Candidatus Saccharibacteria bacterium]|nr:hypothetical protein [Candidatus Saccharibacteria bacterium]MBR3332518.1 hypothetical protein [Candidatus Saccharibacteria bacterium]
MDTATEKTLIKDLKINMKALGIPAGSAEIFTEKIISGVKKSIKSKNIITEQDLNRFVIAEAKKYNTDLAYVYKIHDKII